MLWRKAGWAFVFVGLAASYGLALAGCHATLALTPQEAEGKHLYQARCAHCHEDNDLALKKIPPGLHGIFNRKTLPSGVSATEEAVRQNVLKLRWAASYG